MSRPARASKPDGYLLGSYRIAAPRSSAPSRRRSPSATGCARH